MTFFSYKAIRCDVRSRILGFGLKHAGVRVDLEAAAKLEMLDKNSPK